MKFVTNRISTGKEKSFEDIIKEYQENKVKVASATATIKTAEQDEADSSGQLDVEPLHQEGESTTMPKNGPSAKTEGVDGKEGGKEATATDTNPEAEGDDSEQPKWEGKQENNNQVKFDPNDTPQSEKGGSADGKTKKAALEDLPEEVQDKIKGKDSKDSKDSDDKEEDKDMSCGASEEEDKEEKEATSECQDCKCTPCTCEKKAEKKEDIEEEKEAASECQDCKCTPCTCEKKAEKKEDIEEEKEASSVKFIKIANLNEKNKGFLKEYWTKLFGEDYVSALLADK